MFYPPENEPNVFPVEPPEEPPPEVFPLLPPEIYLLILSGGVVPTFL
jgi:hypothetical protein